MLEEHREEGKDGGGVKVAGSAFKRGAVYSREKSEKKPVLCAEWLLKSKITLFGERFRSKRVFLQFTQFISVVLIYLPRIL